MNWPADKKYWRQELRAQRSKLNAEAIQLAGEKILAQLQKSPRWQQAQHIAAYLSLSGEPDTVRLCQAILDAHKILILPRVSGPRQLQFHQVTSLANLVRSPLGILEPETNCPLVAPTNLDIIIVPGVAFDYKGQRLGQGGGYYDQVLPLTPAKTWRLGHAHDFQVFPQIPTELHDVKVDTVITPSGFYPTQIDTGVC